MSSIIPVDLLAAATDISYLSTIATTNITNPTTIKLLAYNENFTNVLGASATARQLYNLDWEAFHEMGTFNRKTNSVYITSNYVSLDNPINITVLDLGNNYSLTSTRFKDIHEANGGTNYYPPSPPGQYNTSMPPQLLFCDEGDFTSPSALVSIDPTTHTSTILVNNFLGRNFNSLNDVRQHPLTGDLWFTDAAYGFFQSFRPAPTLPNQVYRFSPSTGEIAVVADNLDQSNGLEFSPDLQTLYVTDTGAQHFGANFTRPATIYAFDVVGKQAKTLANRRTFAYVDAGVPDGIHTDTQGNVWAGCGDGVHVWSAGGVLLGKIWVGVTSNNFMFLPGKVLVFSNSQLWVVERVAAVGREICRDFGKC